MSSPYVRFAHRKAVFQQLQRHLLENFMDVELPASKHIISEEVFLKDRVVTQGVLQEILDILQQLEALETKEMNQFELKRREPAVLPILTPKEDK